MFEDLIRLVQFTTGRAQFALSLVLKLEAVQQRAKLVRAIERAQAAAREAWRLNDLWSRRVVSVGRGQAVALDREIDRALVALVQVCEALVKALGAEAGLGALAAAFLDRWFREGVAAVTQLAFEDELAQVQVLLEATTGEGADAASAGALGLAPFLAQLTTLVPKFEAELGKVVVGEVSLDEVRAARHTLQSALALVVAGIVYEFDEDASACAAALAPIRDQQDRLRAARGTSSRREPTDVDPVTGEPEAEG